MTYQAPPPPEQYQPTPPLSPADEKLWATLIHVGGIFLGFWPALIGYLVLKDRGPFVREHTRQALNFQISIAIYMAGAVIVLGIFSIVTLGIGLFVLYPVIIAIGIAATVFMIIAAVRANSGEYYKYPLAIEFIK